MLSWIAPHDVIITVSSTIMIGLRNLVILIVIKVIIGIETVLALKFNREEK